MRKGEPGIGDTSVSVKEKIEIQGARTPSFATNPPARLLDRQKVVQQLERLQRGGKFRRGVEIVLLARWPDGRGLVKAGACEEPGAGQLFQGGEGGRQVAVPIAQIRTEGDVSDDWRGSGHEGFGKAPLRRGPVRR